MCLYVLFFRLFGPSLGVMYYNNLGVIHMGLGKPTLACLYLQKALKEAQVDDDASQSGKGELLPSYWGKINPLNLVCCFKLL